MTKTLRAGALALALITVAPLAALAQDLPAAQDIIDTYVEAIGGRDAALANPSMRMTGTVSVPAMGMSGQLEAIRGEDDDMLQRATISGMGEMLSGYTDGVAWASDPVMGARLLEGAEAAAMADQSDMLYMVRDASLFTSFQTVGEAEYGGEACWEIAFVFASGRETSECFSKDSGLMIASTMSQESPMGSMSVVTRYEDYEQYGDLTLPTTMRQSMMGQEQLMKIESIEFGGVDPSVFTPPAAVLTLIENRR